MVSQLAHNDAVTGRYLREGVGTERVVRRACLGLEVTKAKLLEHLDAHDKAEVYAFELLIRVAEDELVGPLLQPFISPVVHTPGLLVRSLDTALSRLDDVALRRMAASHGIATAEVCSLAESLGALLRDGDMLRMVVASLNDETRALLAALTRGQLVRPALNELVKQAFDCEEDAQAPVYLLCRLGLAFADPGTIQPLWVPVDLQPRIDGILRTFGI